MSAPILATVLSLKKNGSIKSIQRGNTAAPTSSGGAVSVTISEVDPSKSIVSSSARSGTALSSSALGAVVANARLVDATTISVQNATWPTTITPFLSSSVVAWEVVEFY